jgi:hypothetical protein
MYFEQNCEYVITPQRNDCLGEKALKSIVFLEVAFMEHRFLHVFEMLEGWSWPACRWVVSRYGHRPWSSMGRRWSSMGRRWSSMGRLWSLIGRRWVVDGRRWVVDGHQQLLESGVTVGPSQPTPRNETPPISPSLC